MKFVSFAATAAVAAGVGVGGLLGFQYINKPTPCEMSFLDPTRLVDQCAEMNGLCYPVKPRVVKTIRYSE